MKRDTYLLEAFYFDKVLFLLVDNEWHRASENHWDSFTSGPRVQPYSSQSRA